MPDFGPILNLDSGLAGWGAAAALALLFLALVVIGVRLYGHALRAALWRGGLATLGVLLAWVIASAITREDHGALRRALDARHADLTARALAPGSSLACLDGLAHAGLEAACEKALFASPQAVAAALAYVDARLALLAEGATLAKDGRGSATGLERMRRALEADRFGIVAQALAARGCTASECPAFALLRDRTRVVANLNERTFDAQVALHGRGWSAEAPAMASAPPAALPSQTPATGMALTAPAGPAAPVPPQYDFPSADSIPAVSIMEPEPARPAASSAPRAAARRAPSRSAAEPQPGPPTAIVPQPATTGAR